jgi:hypothetical protein
LVLTDTIVQKASPDDDEAFQSLDTICFAQTHQGAIDAIKDSHVFDEPFLMLEQELMAQLRRRSNVIHRDNWEADLKGAIVDCRFALKHSAIYGKGESSFTPMLRRFTVLKAAQSIGVSPRKRKAAADLGSYGSPKKVNGG